MESKTLENNKNETVEVITTIPRLQESDSEELQSDSEEENEEDEYEMSKMSIVGALTYSIRLDWNDIKYRQRAIEELYGYCNEDAYEDGRVYRSEWDGPYNDGDMDLDDYYLIKNKFPKLLKYLDLIDDDLLDQCCSHHIPLNPDCYNSDCDGSCDCYSEL